MGFDFTWAGSAPPTLGVCAPSWEASVDNWQKYRYLGVGSARPIHRVGSHLLDFLSPHKYGSGTASFFHGFGSIRAAVASSDFANWPTLAGDLAAVDAVQICEEDVDHLFRKAHALNRWDLLDDLYRFVWNKWARPICGEGDNWSPAVAVGNKWQPPPNATSAQVAALKSIVVVHSWPGFGPKTLAAIAEVRASPFDDGKLARYANYVHEAAKCGLSAGPWLWWNVSYLSSWWYYDPAKIDPTAPLEIVAKTWHNAPGVADPFTSGSGGCEEDPWLDALLKIVIGAAAAFVAGAGLAAYAAEAAAATGASAEVQSAATFAAKKIGGAMASAGVTGAPIPQAALHAVLSLPPSEIAALVPAVLEVVPVSFFDGLANDLNKLVPLVDSAKDLAEGYSAISSILKPPPASAPIPGGTTAVLPPGGGVALQTSTAAQPPLMTGAPVTFGGPGGAQQWWILGGIAAVVLGLIFFAPSK
jgi:hypothetical protein